MNCYLFLSEFCNEWGSQAALKWGWLSVILQQTCASSAVAEVFNQGDYAVSRRNLAPCASSAVTQSKQDLLSTSSDGPGRNMQQKLSEEILNHQKASDLWSHFQACSLARPLLGLLQLGGAHLLSPRAHQVSGEAMYWKPQCLQRYRSSPRVDLAAFWQLGKLHFHHHFLNSATLIGVTFFIKQPSVGTKSQSPCSLPVTYRAIKIAPSCSAAI